MLGRKGFRSIQRLYTSHIRPGTKPDVFGIQGRAEVGCCAVKRFKGGSRGLSLCFQEKTLNRLNVKRGFRASRFTSKSSPLE